MCTRPVRAAVRPYGWPGELSRELIRWAAVHQVIAFTAARTD
jgi:hypothetical protein